VAEKRQGTRVKAEAARLVLKIVASITESANCPLSYLRVWESVQYEFIENVRQNVWGPNCAERAKHFVTT
jgi:hypothetical protein